MLRTIRETLASGGIRGFFHGYQATFYRDVPVFGVYFTTYSLLMERLDALCGPVTSALLSGSIAGAVFWSIIYPIDNAKTQIQMSKHTGYGAVSHNVLRIVAGMFRRKGLRYVYRGLGTTVLRSLPVNAVLFPVYESCVLALSD